MSVKKTNIFRLAAATFLSFLAGCSISAAAGKQPSIISGIIDGASDEKIRSILRGMEPRLKEFRLDGAGYRARFRQRIWHNDSSGTFPTHAEVDRTCEVRRMGKLLFVESVEKEGSKRSSDVYTYDGSVCAWKSNRSLQIYGFLLPQVHSLMKYFDSIFINAHKDLETSLLSGETYVFQIPDMIVENKDEYKVLEEAEILDGHPCLVLEWPGTDRISLDMRMLGVRKRILMLDGVPYAEFSNSEFSEYGESAWLPSKCTLLHRALPGQSDRAAGSIVGREEIELLDVSFGGLSEGDFRIELPPDERCYVLDTVRKIGYRRVPAGEDTIMATLAEAKSITISPVRSRLWLTLALVSGLFVQVYLLRTLGFWPFKQIHMKAQTSV